MGVDLERRQIKDIYPDLVGEYFPNLNNEVLVSYDYISQFRDETQTGVVDLQTDFKSTRDAAMELQFLARSIARGILKSGADPRDLYKMAISPAMRAGSLDLSPDTQVGVRREGINYTVLERSRSGMSETGLPVYNLIAMLQRVPNGLSTHPEVHFQGIEVYVPLVDGIEFHVNDRTYRPGALDKIITILPGDLHYHRREKGPARVLIIGGFGFTRGTKTNEVIYQVPGFREIPRRIGVLNVK